MKRSAGILPYRCKDGKLQVFLGHLGGPFWAKKQRSWGIIKGEIEKDETPIEAAKREFFEETGKQIEGDFMDLGSVRTANKEVRIYATVQDLSGDITSNMVQMEYHGKQLRFPEIDKAAWFDIEAAKDLLIAYQVPFLERLENLAQKKCASKK